MGKDDELRRALDEALAAHAPESERELTPKSRGVMVDWEQDPTAVKRAAKKQGMETDFAPRSQAPSSWSPRPMVMELPWYKSTRGMAIVVPLLVGLVGSMTGSAVVIINAVREPSKANADLQQLLEEKKRREAAAPLDALRAEAAEKARQDVLLEMRSKYQELDLRFPKQQVDPNRRPRR